MWNFLAPEKKCCCFNEGNYCKYFLSTELSYSLSSSTFGCCYGRVYQILALYVLNQSAIKQKSCPWVSTYMRWKTEEPRMEWNQNLYF